MPKRKSAPAPTAAEPPQPAVGDLVWVLGLGGEALEKPWPAIVRDVVGINAVVKSALEAPGLGTTLNRGVFWLEEP